MMPPFGSHLISWSRLPYPTQPIHYTDGALIWYRPEARSDPAAAFSFIIATAFC